MSELRKFKYFVNNEWKEPITADYFESETLPQVFRGL